MRSSCMKAIKRISPRPGDNLFITKFNDFVLMSLSGSEFPIVLIIERDKSDVSNTFLQLHLQPQSRPL